MQNNINLVVGFITYNTLTAKYLPYFLPSLLGQSYRDFEIFAVDNSENIDNPNIDYLQKAYPDIPVKQMGQNLGFARANNIIIGEAIKRGAEFVMLLNPDTILEKDAVEKMVKIMAGDSALGSASAKILRWDFDNNTKTAILDSCGIIVKSGLRFFDLGQGQRDSGQFNNAEILGPSGTAPLYRSSSLKKIERNGQYFDEMMFMYKEDCDLAYRLKLAGYGSKLVNEARIYHDRTTFGKGESDVKVALNRRNKNRQAKEWAFFNQHMMFIKFWHTLSIGKKISVLWYAFEMFIFVLIFEQFLLKQYVMLWKIKNKISPVEIADNR